MPRPGRTRAPRRLFATSVAVTVITLLTALATFSSGGLAVEVNQANFRDEPRTGAPGNTAPGRSNPDAISPGQLPKDLKQELEEAADIVIQFDNSSDVPLVITAASIKVVKMPSEPGASPNRYRVSPDVLLQSATDRRVTGLVLCFTCKCGKADKTWLGEGGLNLTTGAEYRFKGKPRREVFELDGDPNRLRVSVAAVLLEGEDIWVNVDQTGRRKEGTRAVRSDSRSSKLSSPLEAASSSQGHEGQSESSASAHYAKDVTDAICVGDSCPLSILKALGDIIGLPVVFEESAEARVQGAGAFYLRNLRRGDILEITLLLNGLKYSRTGNQLNVKDNDLPQSLYRLNLSN